MGAFPVALVGWREGGVLVKETDNGGKSNSLGSFAKLKKLCMVESLEITMSDHRLGRERASASSLILAAVETGVRNLLWVLFRVVAGVRC